MTLLKIIGGILVVAYLLNAFVMADYNKVTGSDMAAYYMGKRDLETKQQWFYDGVVWRRAAPNYAFRKGQWRRIRGSK